MRIKLLSAVLCIVMLLSCLTSCETARGSDDTDSGSPEHVELIDHGSAVKLDMSSNTAKLEVKVKSFIDGDTVHFYADRGDFPNGVLKARFLAINTPESTGKIEEYGKKASEFTKSVLSQATSIIVESESSGWNPDSTGSRYLVWVWYKHDGDSEYRNLNLEILENGLAIANNTAGSRYGEYGVSAINQAKAQKLNIYSGQKDPDYYYGDAIELSLRELRANISEYVGMKVAFNGVITANSGTQGVYVEDYDEDSEHYYGIYIYYGHGLNGDGLNILSVGNEVRIVGTVQYYEAGGTYQVSDLNYRLMKPDDPGNIQKLSDGHSAAFIETDADTFKNGKITLLVGEENRTFTYAEAAMGTSISMLGLHVKSVYTTDNEESSSNGALTLTCEVDGITVTVRTAVLRDSEGKLITGDEYLGKTIDVKGIVDSFDGEYQIKVFSAQNITVIK